MLWGILPDLPRISCTVRRMYPGIRNRREGCPEGTLPDQDLLHIQGAPDCADCPEFEGCGTLGGFHAKDGYKYGKYRQALLFIREKGCAAFVTVADEWTGACGRYPARAGGESSAAIGDSPAADGDDAAR